MKVYVFGNRDLPQDCAALKVLGKLRRDFKDTQFIEVKPNEDLPFGHGENVIILDAVCGLKNSKILEHDDVSKIALPPRNSAHDFDLGFQLRYLKKLGKLGKVTIIGLPQEGAIDYSSIQSILRKLVAQDIQGS